jgi:phosphate transport system protein
VPQQEISAAIEYPIRPEPAHGLQTTIPEIDRGVLHLFALVTEGLAAATAAFLENDCVAARAVVAGDRRIDLLESDVEDLVIGQLLALPAPSSDVLRTLVGVLRIVPELERSGDLVEHIALRTPQGMSMSLTPRARGLVAEMGRVGVEMWRAAADAYAERDTLAADRLRHLDDQLDDLHVTLCVELAESVTSTPVAIEMGLVARFLERLGDHAVNVTRRLRDLRPQVDEEAL